MQAQKSTSGERDKKQNFDIILSHILQSTSAQRARKEEKPIKSETSFTESTEDGSDSILVIRKKARQREFSLLFFLKKI